MSSKKISRKKFLSATFLSVSFIPTLLVAKDDQQDKPAQLPGELVREFVGVCHSNLPRVKEMLEKEPLLLHVSWDWGGGDFESGIEAAGHVGNKAIATYLLSKGARYNIFLGSMLGHVDIVRQTLELNPQLLNAKGAHGFTLLHHAQKGEATTVVSMLESLGAKETRINFYGA